MGFKDLYPDLHIPSHIQTSKAFQFCVDVLNDELKAGNTGEIIKSGVKRKQACMRFVNELERSVTDPKYPWVFNLEKAYRPITFIERFLTPTKSEYSRMELLPWQHFIEANMYGWLSRETGYRRYREALIVVGQGNGKTTMIAGNAAFGLTKDGERGPEIYCLANSREQARLLFNECSAQINGSKILSKHIKATRDGLFYENGKFQPLASDSKNLDGRNVHIAVFDEIHEYRDYDLMNVIRGKTIKRKNPLIIYITTMGKVIDGPLMDLYVLGSQILSDTGAIAQRAADRTFVYIDEIDEDDDVDNPVCWGKANPSLGVLIDIEDLKDKWERAKPIPSDRMDFINKQCNVFTQIDELSFLDPKTIRKNDAEYDLDKLKGALCYGGFDLSTSEDFTAACLEFPLPDNQYFVLQHSWVPEHKVKLNREKLDWDFLVKSGWLTVVNKDYVELEYIRDWFLEMKKLYRIDAIGYDPAKATVLVQEMAKEGFKMDVVKQGEITLTAPLDDLKERFLDGKIIHNNNRLFNYYLGNVRLTKRSVNATYLPTKQSKYRKIDGFAALLDAHTEYLRKRPTQIPPDRKVSRVIRLN